MTRRCFLGGDCAMESWERTRVKTERAIRLFFFITGANLTRVKAASQLLRAALEGQPGAAVPTYTFFRPRSRNLLVRRVGRRMEFPLSFPGRRNLLSRRRGFPVA